MAFSPPTSASTQPQVNLQLVVTTVQNLSKAINNLNKDIGKTLKNIPADVLIGNPTGADAELTVITLGATLLFASSVLKTAAGTGDVTWAGNTFATTITDGVITLAKMANLPANTIIGNNTGGSATPLALTVSQVVAMLAATGAQYLANASNVVLTPNAVWNAAAEVTLTYASTVTPDLSTGINFGLTLTGGATLATPTNGKAGQTGLIYLTQGAGGSHTLAYGGAWKFPNGVAPILSTAAGAVDVLAYTYRSSSFVAGSIGYAYA